MTAAQIATVARFITNTNSTTVTDANFLRLLSERCKQFVLQLSKLKEDYALEVSTTPLVSGQEEYPMPLDAIRIKRLEVQWTSGGTWYPVTFYDINESSSTNDSTAIGNEFTRTQPFADVLEDSVFMRPIPQAADTGQLKMWYVQRPGDLSATTETPDIPVEYHRMLADLVAIDIRQSKADLTPAQALASEDAIWAFLKQQVSPRVTDEPMIVKPSYENYE